MKNEMFSFRPIYYQIWLYQAGELLEHEMICDENVLHMQAQSGRELAFSWALEM